MNTFVYALSFVLIFLSSLLNLASYRNGFRDGFAIGKGKPMPVPTEHPRSDSKKPKEEETDMVLEGLNNLMTYDGNPPERK
jgi:hypothetical protein